MASKGDQEQDVRGWTFRVKKVSGINEYRTMFYLNGNYCKSCDYFTGDRADATSTGSVECERLNSHIGIR